MKNEKLESRKMETEPALENLKYKCNVLNAVPKVIIFYNKNHFSSDFS